MKNMATGSSNHLKGTLLNSLKNQFHSKISIFALLVGMLQILAISIPANSNAVETVGSAYLPAGSYLRSTNSVTLGNSAFTIDVWFKTVSDPATSKFVILGGSGNRGITIYNGTYGGGNFSATKLTVDFETAGDVQFTVPTLTANTWYHLALSRNASLNWAMWLNGTRTSDGVRAIGWDFIANTYAIGTWTTQFGSSTAQYISNFRMTNTNIYDVNSATISVPTKEFDRVAGTLILLNTRYDAANFNLDKVSNQKWTITGSASSSSVAPSITLAKIDPTFSWANVSKTIGDANFTISAPTPSTPGTFTYSSATSNVIALDATYTDSATVALSGSSVITASFTPTDSANYASATTTMTITVNKKAQSVVVLALSSTSFNGSGSKAITFSTTGGTDTGTVSYSVKSGGTASGCALSKANTSTSDTITATSTGTCLIQAVKAATNNYATETSTAVTFNFLSPQTIAYDSGTATSGTTPTGGTYYAGDTITVSSGSGLSKPGFKLNGWKNNSNVSYAVGSTFTISTTDTLTAQWRQASLFGIADADLTEVQNWNVINGFSAGGNIGNGTDTFTVTVPANALTAGTSVKLYALSSTALAQSKIGAGNTYILNMVVSWLYGQTVPTASSAVTLRIESPSIKKDAIAYMIIGDTVTAVGTATQDGVINTYFTEDPVITVVNPVVQNNNGGGGGGGNSVTTVEKPAEIAKPVEISKPVNSKMISMSTKVYFGLNASWINSLNIKSVKEFMAKVSLSAAIKEVTIQGFTQPTAINPDPLGLSKARANSVAKLVKVLGITSKVVAVGKGNEKKNLPSSRYVLVTVTGEAKS